ncbi:zona pellucida sperm-binding protein 3-like isoform X1 [Thunnus albacares]|uniref:zona pellucida sperm-binding protein 3-like isoform X1 n=1 Tax=Thunnus albacares TaxID=8236 RepID=UPI001CF6B94E|nr:zona pellucida sperm-binding protein 3-like isoform X1 [Thunnus albacares]
MPLISVHFTFSIYILFKLVAVRCYTYQTKPLFLSFSDLAALEANSNKPNTHPWSNTRDPAGIITAAGEHKVKTFVVKCHEDSIEVVMKAYLFDPALPVEPTHLRLGPVSAAHSHCTARKSEHGEYIIRAALSDCGGRVMFTESAVLYKNLLLYSPPPKSQGDVFYVEGAAVPVQCKYKSRRYTVSSRALKPTWSPLISVHSTHLHLDFHLRLMTNDWNSERKSSVYFLGEMINIEASVDHRHLPLRLYADSCVTTLTSDVKSYPRYPFIDHQGCFTDSQLNGSSSRFLPRVQDTLLQIQLEPFLFHQDHRHTIYITCHLEAEPTSNNKNPEKKACSFMSGRWKSVDGEDDVCESCNKIQETNRSNSDEPGHKRAPRSKTKYRLNELQRETTVGPIIFLPRKAEHSGNDKYLY